MQSIPSIFFFCLWFFLSSINAFAADFQAKVIHITDGDTIIVLNDTNEQIKIRLNGIDCPEKGQAYGNKAKNFTKDLVAGQPVIIQAYGQDRYGRTSHFTPFLEVKILGFTEEKELALLDEENDSPLEIIGKWKDLAWPAVITIYRERGVLFMDLEFGKESMFKGANIKKEMISEAIMGQTRFREKNGNPHGEYYAIDSKGDLSMYDSEGFMRTAQSLGTF